MTFTVHSLPSLFPIVDSATFNRSLVVKMVCSEKGENNTLRIQKFIFDGITDQFNLWNDASALMIIMINNVCISFRLMNTTKI